MADLTPSHLRTRRDWSERGIATDTNDRVKRIETRLTQFMEQSGFDTGVQRPIYDASRKRVVVPSRGTSLKYIIAAVPHSIGGDARVEVYCGTEHLCDIMLP